MIPPQHFNCTVCVHWHCRAGRRPGHAGASAPRQWVAHHRAGDPAELSPGEFVAAVCRAAHNGARVVVIDSVNGYLNAMPEEQFLITYLHELLTYLGQCGVVTILVGVQQGMVGGQMSTAVDVSYLACNVLLLLRHYEHDGEVKQAVSVFKKRGSLHERTIRQFFLSSKGIQVGGVLRGFRGILTGVPAYAGESEALSPDDAPPSADPAPIRQAEAF